MASYLDSSIELITDQDVTWRNKINSNFSIMAAYQSIITTTYVVDSDPPKNCTLDRILFLDVATAGGNMTITLPLASSFQGREIVFIVQSTHATYTRTVTSSSTINGDTTIENVLGLRTVYTSDGTSWYGINADN